MVRYALLGYSPIIAYLFTMRIDFKVSQRINESRHLIEGLSPDGKTFEVYHRTGSDINGDDVNALTDRVQSIIKNGFRSGSGAMYGRGFYSTGDFESQFGMRGQKYGNMAGNYGMAIIKYQVPTKGLFVFDYRLAKKIYGGNVYTLADQYHKIAPNKPIPHVIEVLSDDLEQTLVDPKLSADRAYAFWGRFLYQSKGKPGVKFWRDYDTTPPLAVLNGHSMRATSA